MATNQDYNAVSQGLDSITRAVLGSFMARQQREQLAAEEKRREQERADRLAFQAWQQQDREKQRKLQEQAAQDAAAARKAQEQRLTAQEAERVRAGRLKEQAAQDAAGLQKAFMQQFDPAVQADPRIAPTSYDEAIGATTPPALRIENPADLMQAAQRVPGVLTPQQMVELAIRNQAATVKSTPEPAKNIEPVLKDYELGGGQKLRVLYNPATGANTLIKDPVQNKVAVRDVLAVRAALQKNTARMQELLAVPPENFGLPERREYKSLQEDNAFLNGLINPLIDEAPSAPAPAAADQVGAATEKMPRSGAQFKLSADGTVSEGGKVLIPGTATPPDDREQFDGSADPSPVSVQPAKPEVPVVPQLRGVPPPQVISARPPLVSSRGGAMQQARGAGLARDIAANLEQLKGGVRKGFDQGSYNQKYAATQKMIAELQGINPDLAAQFR